VSHRDRPLSARDAERLHGIPASTVRTWYQRRARTGLYPVGRDRRGNPLFRESDLLHLRRSAKPLRGRDGQRCDRVSS
jgi:hypothetical protein